jgi:hypothetical protein
MLSNWQPILSEKMYLTLGTCTHLCVCFFTSFKQVHTKLDFQNLGVIKGTNYFKGIFLESHESIFKPLLSTIYPQKFITFDPPG